VVRVEADALILQLHEEEVSRVQLSSVQQLQVSRGRTRRFGRSVLIGGAAGVAVGALVGVGASGGGQSDFVDPAVCGLVIGAPVGAVTGVIIGVIAGATSKHEQWEDVPMTRPLVSFAPHGGGALALGVSVRF
jgi:hypothetical protein